MTPGTNTSATNQRIVLEQLDVDHIGLAVCVEADPLVDQLARDPEQLITAFLECGDRTLGVDLSPEHVFKGFEVDRDLVDLLPGADEEGDAVFADDRLLDDLQLVRHGTLLLDQGVMPSRTLSAITPLSVTCRPTHGYDSVFQEVTR